MENTTNSVPTGWMIAGSHPADYQVGVDHTYAHSGQASGYLRSDRSRPRGFGTLMQMYQADQYRGQRLRLSAYIRIEEVANWAGLWMRVDGVAGKHLSFDNMQDRALEGTSDWSRYEIVLDVPGDSLYIAFGILLTGKGQVWLDDIQFEAVGPDVPVTGQMQREYAMAPSNLDFEE